MELKFPTDYRIVQHRTIPDPEDGILLFCDPCYANPENDEWGAVFFTDYTGAENWTVFTIEDSHGIRAMGLVNEEVPPELLQTFMEGSFVIIVRIGVDTGQVGIYDAEYNELVPAMHTYLGDGIFPVAMWGKNGHPYAIVVLTDPRYYDKEWGGE